MTDTAQVAPPLVKRTPKGKHKACWFLFAFKVILVLETITFIQLVDSNEASSPELKNYQLSGRNVSYQDNSIQPQALYAEDGDLGGKPVMERP